MSCFSAGANMLHQLHLPWYDTDMYIWYVSFLHGARKHHAGEVCITNKNTQEWKGAEAVAYLHCMLSNSYMLSV